MTAEQYENFTIMVSSDPQEKAWHKNKSRGTYILKIVPAELLVKLQNKLRKPSKAQKRIRHGILQKSRI